MVHETRLERDLLGERALPSDALYGIHTARAMENFPLSGRRIHPDLFRALGAVKWAAAQVNLDLGYLEPEIGEALLKAARELQTGCLDPHCMVDALQGGAGTSSNMNANEVIANRALQILGCELGDYQRVSPLGHVNLHQSTNDVFPTALRIAAMWGLGRLEDALVELVQAFQEKEHQFVHVVKLGRTQLQDAVLTTLGRSMSAFAEALSRDRWRIFKCNERLRVVNLGGTAIGTGIFAPRQYIFRVVDVLRGEIGLGLARAENLVEATQNLDPFVEVSGLLKTLASSLIKISRDLRLLASGPDAGFGEIRLPRLQAGSSVMPGKVNPVIPEAMTQAAMVVVANDQAITAAAYMGDLELNAFLPLIADRLLESLDLLTRGVEIFARKCVVGIEADERRCLAQVKNATASVTALMDELGYAKAQEVVRFARDERESLRNAALQLGVISAEDFDELTAPERVLRLGSRVKREKE